MGLKRHFGHEGIDSLETSSQPHSPPTKFQKWVHRIYDYLHFLSVFFLLIYFMALAEEVLQLNGSKIAWCCWLWRVYYWLTKSSPMFVQSCRLCNEGSISARNSSKNICNIGTNHSQSGMRICLLVSYKGWFTTSPLASAVSFDILPIAVHCKT